MRTWSPVESTPLALPGRACHDRHPGFASDTNTHRDPRPRGYADRTPPTQPHRRQPSPSQRRPPAPSRPNSPLQPPTPSSQPPHHRRRADRDPHHQAPPVPAPRRGGRARLRPATAPRRRGAVVQRQPQGAAARGRRVARARQAARRVVEARGQRVQVGRAPALAAVLEAGVLGGGAAAEGEAALRGQRVVAFLGGRAGLAWRCGGGEGRGERSGGEGRRVQRRAPYHGAAGQGARAA